ncbi:plasmodesmata-located protein 2-like [Impatiens glandulifera]|uniref:plasmodesmata-located protein 2-like n=1 Tax=Impatiens glandulifera TaxID=253017 RepID=UPI001FB11F5F|nr:plasmodesmata-located protein 2-like [Impatiens glandulifera]
MGFSLKPFCLLFLLFFFTINASDYTTLIYKGCGKQPLSDPTGLYSQAISSLYGTLVSQSSKAKFFQATTGNKQSAINGVFQCRGDLSNVDCYNCVSRLPILIDKLCDGFPVAARIQLVGCYMLYEASGFPQVSGLELLYKTCSGSNKQGSGFEEKRDTALYSLENGIISSGNGGFYVTSYESVYVLAQCEGTLGNGDCGECVKSAVQRAQVECGSSVSGQVYLDKCFISYNYGSSKNRPSAAAASDSSFPTPSSSSSSSNSFSSGPGQNVNTGKTVAIILGGATGLGFVVICLLVIRNSMKKHDHY